MKSIKEHDWILVDNLELEKNALDVATAPVSNFLIVAGPGAGKTELLAQRACFLLQTNTCQFPHRILAISFKRDAAYNLKERVKLRAGVELTNRFDSLTYDSFAKQILDRFRASIPKEYHVPSQYAICWDDDIIDMYRIISEYFTNTNEKKAIISFHTESKLSLGDDSEENKIRKAVWMLALKRGTISFQMIMRLAEFIIATNPKIKLYLQKTYDYIFLDEFQDTTTIQYEFLATCFKESNKVFTAVGDDKQRIMLWAGARRTIFEDFQRDYTAERIPLKMNFRSAPILVKVQNNLIKTLLNKSDFAIPSNKWKDDQGECIIWEFENQDEEAKHLLEYISLWTQKINPREICVLVKGSLSRYVTVLIETLNLKGIKARDEGLFQDFLTDDVILYVIHTLYLVAGAKGNNSKKIVFDFLSKVNNELSDQQLIVLENRLSTFIKELKNQHNKKEFADKDLRNLIKKIIMYAKPERIRAMFGAYKQTNYLAKILGEFELNLVQCFKSSKSLIETLDQFCGKDTIPIMTVHKSKGLEYHTVLFVGLEDGAFWSYSSQPDEDKSTFFVALSRAKERVVFTFSKIRQGLKRPNQSRKLIAEIFDQMKKAGVPIRSV